MRPYSATTGTRTRYDAAPQRLLGRRPAGNSGTTTATVRPVTTAAAHMVYDPVRNDAVVATWSQRRPFLKTPPRWFFPLIAVVVLLLAQNGRAAQDASQATPVASPASSPSTGATGRLDLAAMVLDADAVPEGYVRFFEAYVAGERAAEEILGDPTLADQLTRTGLQWFYESQYETLDQTSTIRFYVEQYPDDADARAGFDFLEDEAFFGAGPDARDEPLTGVGEEPAELTLVSSPASGTNPAVELADATFRVGRLLGGVSIETEGQAPDPQLVRDLAGRLAQRIQAVLDGQSPAGADLALPTRLLPLDPDGQAVQEGYLLARELFPAAAASADVAPGFVAAYERALSPPDAPAASGTYLFTAVAQFDAPDGALTALQEAADMALPFGSEPERADAVRVASVDAAVAFRSALNSDSGPDSFWIMLVVNDRMAVVGVMASPDAEAAALDLAAQQASCLATDAPCAAVNVPSLRSGEPGPPETPAGA